MQQYTYSKTERGASVSVLVDGRFRHATERHPNWTRIVSRLRNGQTVTADLFEDASSVLIDLGKRLGMTLTSSGGDLLVNGKVRNDRLGRKIVDVVTKGLDPEPLVRFMANLEANPSANSRDQLFAYLERYDFEITKDGNFIAYKGVAEGGLSLHSGTAYVNGHKVVGRIPNKVGDTITMPRREVNDNINHGCSTGLHAGTYAYAKGYSSRGHMLEVEINPADVVSIPHDVSYQKIRTCKYLVLDVLHDAPVIKTYRDEDDGGWASGYEAGYLEGQEDAAEGIWA